MMRIPLIHVTFSQPSYVIKPEDELKSLRKKLNGAASYLEKGEREYYNEYFKVKEDTHKMFP